MPTELGAPFPITYDGIPTHMSTQDLTIWQRWRSRIPPNARAIYFDVRLGEGHHAGDDAEDDARRMWYQLTAKRADVVLEMPQGWLLLELRDSAQSNAIGRLLLYQKLWKADPPDPRPLSLMLITNARDPDVEGLAEDHGIGYLVV
jgi:hypothetical protein